MFTSDFFINQSEIESLSVRKITRKINNVKRPVLKIFGIGFALKPIGFYRKNILILSDTMKTIDK